MSQKEKTEWATTRLCLIREQIEKWNQMTAVRFQAWWRHSKCPTSLRAGAIDRLSEWGMDCLLACLLAWFIDWLIDWLGQWVIDGRMNWWMIDWLIDWLIGSVSECDSLIDGWMDGRIEGLIDCLINCLLAWLTDWLGQWVRLDLCTCGPVFWLIDYSCSCFLWLF